MRSAELVPHVRDLFSLCPEYFWLEPWELQDVLFSLGYTDDLVDEGEIWAAVEIARGVCPQCGGQQREQKEAIQPPLPAWRSTDRAARGEASEASKRSCQAEVTRSETEPTKEVISVEIAQAMTRPDVNGTPSLPKRAGPKGLLPSTWVERPLKLEYVDGFGAGVQVSGVLLDYFPAGPVLHIDGVKTLISWDRLVVAQLVED